VSYLANAGTTLSIKGEDVFIAGIDSIWGGTPDPSKTWSGHQRHQPVISLVHEPDAFDHLRPSHRITSTFNSQAIPTQDNAASL